MAHALNTARVAPGAAPTGQGLTGRLALLGGLLLAGGLLAGCRQDMHDTPRYEALEESDFFADRRAMRPIPDGTVARGNLREDDVFYTGKVDGEPVHELPAQVTVDQALLGADIVLHLTEWPEFRQLDPERLGELVKTKIIIDGRLKLDARSWRRAGWKVVQIGRATTL